MLSSELRRKKNQLDCRKAWLWLRWLFSYSLNCWNNAVKKHETLLRWTTKAFSDIRTGSVSPGTQTTSFFLPLGSLLSFGTSLIRLRSCRMQSQLLWTSLLPPFLLPLSPLLFYSPTWTDLVAPDPSWQAKLRWHPLSLTPVGKLIKMSASISSLTAWMRSFISACSSSGVCFYLVNDTREDSAQDAFRWNCY